jgi:tRNA A-37 threonylcarbamoyl transferase component Bud32
MLRKLEKYEILEELGHGGMATVYRARDTVLDRSVALKVMHPHLRAAEEARRRFHREARSVARLHHPRVLEIYDFSGEGSEEAYIAAELLTGPTLKIWREKQKEVPAEVAAAFVIEIAQALEAAHAAGIVHRDVKPENVLLHENKAVKLTDFGIADMVDSQSMTATGQILGSPGHMAPEQIEGKDCDARTDLFSLGTVLYYLATGRLPFTGRNPHQVLKRIIDGEYADPLRVNPTIGGRMRAIIVKTLDRDPAQRFQSAAELAQELADFLAESGFDDPEKLVEKYLHDPEKTTEDVRKQTVDRLIDLGARASDAGDVPKALDYYNRVLALDEGNERVLKLIERVGIDRRRRVLMLAGFGLMVFGALTTLGAWALWPGPPDPDDDPQPIVNEQIDAGMIVDAAIATAVDAGFDASASTVVQIDAGSDAGTRDDPRPLMRAVLLRADPPNVMIAIDDDPPRSPGVVTLRPGTHRFRVIPGASIPEYDETERTHSIPAGTGEYTLTLRAAFREGLLRVRSNVPSDVYLASGERLGRTNQTLRVPMSAASAQVDVTVRSPGYRDGRGSASLRAGADTVMITVDLLPDTPSP